VSATTSGDHERAHDESTNRSAEKHRKNQGKLGVPKRGVFGGSAETWENGTTEWSKGMGTE
jgi:hypothetical protein